MTFGDKDKIGFGGFDDLVSDVSKEIEAPSQIATPATERVKTTSSSSQGNSVSSSQLQQPSPATIVQNASKGGNDATSWGWIAFVIFVVFVMIASSEEREVEEPAAPYSSYQDPYSSSLSESIEVTEEQTPTPLDPKNPEELPLVGKELVPSQNQIRYCLSMDVRLSTIKDALDFSSQTEIEKFIAAIDDFNSRCSNYRYKRGSVENIQSEVNLNHSSLVIEGLKTLESWRATDLNSKKSSYNPDAQSVSDTLEKQSSKNKSNQNDGSDANNINSNDLQIPDLTDLSPDEKRSIEGVCNTHKSLYGPAAYYKCLQIQVEKLNK